MIEELTKAKKKALALLTDMDRTERELCEKLKKKGYTAEVIEETVAYVNSFGYLDDARYANLYISSQKKKRSRRRIIFDLKKKGIPTEILDQALAEAGGWDERPLIRKYAEKKDALLAREDPKRYQKLASHLASKGFSPADIASVLREDLFFDAE